MINDIVSPKKIINDIVYYFILINHSLTKLITIIVNEYVINYNNNDYRPPLDSTSKLTRNVIA